MPIDENTAWLRLTLIAGIGGATQRKLLTAFGLPEAIFSASRSSLAKAVGEKAANLLCDYDEAELNAKIETSLHWASQPGQHLITLADSRYPKSLLEIDDPPTLLYVRGNPDLLSRTGLGIVGARNATPQGMQTAEQFARYLAAQGVNVVSGLALGIDTAAHQGALASQGPTIAVIGTGIDRLYPASNKTLALRILETGVIVSEFPLGTPAIGSNFPRRNRIISGLSRGVLVVEAAVDSGSLITAKLAAEQGREVFAIPGSIHSPLSRGCHKLIKQGAKLVETAQDILEELGWQIAPAQTAPARRAGKNSGKAKSGQTEDSGNTIAESTEATTDSIPAPTVADSDSPNRPALPAPEQAILEALAHAPCTLDELLARTGQSADSLLGSLLTLELQGHVATLPGNQYQRLAC